MPQETAWSLDRAPLGARVDRARAEVERGVSSMTRPARKYFETMVAFTLEASLDSVKNCSVATPAYTLGSHLQRFC
jgi:hypothetical protein